MLHDNARVPLKDATMSQLEASIRWYKKKIREYENKLGWNTARLKDYLALCEAERAGRIGKKKKKR